MSQCVLACFTLLAGCGAAATTLKYIEQLDLAFAPQNSVVGTDQIHQLSRFARNMATRCVVGNAGSIVVAVEAIVSQQPSSGERATALARIKSTKQALLSLGVPEQAIFDGLATDKEMADRRTAAGLAAPLPPNTVAIELVCDPR